MVGDDRDLGRAVLAVGAHDPAEQPLGRGHVDVARPGEYVGRGAVLGAVREHGQGLRAADRVHLLHAEQRARGEHGRVRQAAVVGLWRGGHRNRGDPRDLRGHHVHHDGGGIGDQAAGHIDPGPADRDVPAGHGETLGRRDHGVGARHLGLMHEPGPAGGLLQRGGHGRVEVARGLVERFAGHARGGQVDSVEAGGVLAHRRGAPAADVLAHRPDLLGGRRDVEHRTRQDSGQGGPGEGGGIAVTQVNTGDHPHSLRSVPGGRRG